MVKKVSNYFNYTLSYPEGFLSDEGEDLGKVVFYVGKGTRASRMDDHLREAAKGCPCGKCCVIRWIWEKRKSPLRSIVFETPLEHEALNNERHLIQVVYKSNYLTNVRSTHVKPYVGKNGQILYVNMQTPPVFKDGGETYYNVSVACRFTGVGVVGTRFLVLASEFGLNKLVKGNVTYYCRSELLAFLDWVNIYYPNESISPNLQDPEKDLPKSMFIGLPCDG